MAKIMVFKPSFNQLTRAVADGKWVALSSDGTELLADEFTINEARAAAEKLGERDPVLFRINRVLR